MNSDTLDLGGERRGPARRGRRRRHRCGCRVPLGLDEMLVARRLARIVVSSADSFEFFHELS